MKLNQSKLSFPTNQNAWTLRIGRDRSEAVILFSQKLQSTDEVPLYPDFWYLQVAISIHNLENSY